MTTTQTQDCMLLLLQGKNHKGEGNPAKPSFNLPGHRAWLPVYRVKPFRERATLINPPSNYPLRDFAPGSQFSRFNICNTLTPFPSLAIKVYLPPIFTPCVHPPFMRAHAVHAKIVNIYTCCTFFLCIWTSPFFSH